MTDSASIQEQKTRRRWQPGLSSMIWLGLILGIATGLFFGELCHPLSHIGDAFIRLLQMTILPYIVVALIANIGRLSLTQNRQLFAKGGLVLALLWGIAMVSLVALPMAFPTWKAGAFYSAAMTEKQQPLNLLELFIPENFFASLASGNVSAIVILCIAVGFGLASLPNRATLITQLDILAGALTRVSTFVSKLTPIGVFAISASAAGTVSWEDAGRLQAYLIVYTCGAIFLTFVVLPLVITTLTDFSYREVMFVSRDAMTTAFATGKLIVVLPLLIAQTEKLIARRHEPGEVGVVPAVDVLYPFAYPFPHIGKLFGMLFIPFSAWFVGHAMELGDYPHFLTVGWLSYFSGPLLATPVLLDQMRLPHDMFQLFVVSGVYCGRLGDMLGAMHLVAFTLITGTAFLGKLRLDLGVLARLATIVIVLGFIMIGSLRQGLAFTLKYTESRDEVLSHMKLLDDPIDAFVYRNPAPNPTPLLSGESLLGRIRRRDRIRIGYGPSDLPFAYVNSDGQLVGFDVNMAHFLARDMGVRLEFVPINRDHLFQESEDDYFDIAMSGIAATLDRAEQLTHTTPYMELTLAFVVPDHEIRRFSSITELRRRKAIRVGITDTAAAYTARIYEQLPNVELVPLVSAKQYFQEKWMNLDALMISAEAGAAHTLYNPEYEVVVPDGLRINLPLFYIVSHHDIEFRDFLEHWMLIRKKDGTFEKNYAHWILGQSLDLPQPRWCIARDVLGWLP
jgi:Na+/H+-dicarboxylate symporter